MKSYRTYVNELMHLAKQPASRSVLEVPLNGGASHRLRQLISRKAQRTSSAFFTDSRLSSIVASQLELTPSSVLYDPACGAGDLLLATARHLPTHDSIEQTLSHWGRSLSGRDLHSEFVDTACARLHLLALIARPGKLSASHLTLGQLHALLPALSVGSGLAEKDELQRATHVVMNPPFKRVLAPKSCTWKTGLVNSAALFLDHVTAAVESGTDIVAILPDVLRSGSGYERWRKLVNERCTVRGARILGRFDEWADVDVFLMQLRRRKKAPRSVGTTFAPSAPSRTTIGDKFTLSIGNLVDYRDPHEGERASLLDTTNAPRWGTVRELGSTRLTSKRLIEGPFVAIRRTSSPSDKDRAVGTVVDIAHGVVVENHLIVARPKRGSIAQCQRLLRLLKNPSTTRWLNSRIRCRHLTLDALSNVPWQETDV